MSDFDKSELTAQCLKVLGNDCYNAIIEHDNFELTVEHFVRYLLKGSHSHAYELAGDNAKRMQWSILQTKLKNYFQKG